MVCVGTRAWAWKRLMTKSIFYNAFQKVMTRSSVQLSLYDAEVPASNFNLKTLLQRHNLTTPVFGDLQDKQEMLKANHKPKLTQLIFSEYTTTNRRGSIDNSTTEFREVKIPNMTTYSGAHTCARLPMSTCATSHTHTAPLSHALGLAHLCAHAHMHMHTARQTASHRNTGYHRKDTHENTHT